MQEEQAAARPEKPTWKTPKLSKLVCLNEADAGKHNFSDELGNISTLFTTGGTYHQAGPNS